MKRILKWLQEAEDHLMDANSVTQDVCDHVDAFAQVDAKGDDVRAKLQAHLVKQGDAHGLKLLKLIDDYDNAEDKIVWAIRAKHFRLKTYLASGVRIIRHVINFLWPNRSKRLAA